MKEAYVKFGTAKLLKEKGFKQVKYGVNVKWWSYPPK